MTVFRDTRFRAAGPASERGRSSQKKEHNVRITLLAAAFLAALLGGCSDAAKAKADADKVVAERDAEIAALKKELADLKAQIVDDAKMREAKMRMYKIDGAVQAYKIDYGDFPDGLQVLTQRGEKGGPYVSEAELLDPMKQVFQYDKNGGHQRPPGSKPDIFTTVNGKPVANWAK
jgi:hypothetical protein